MSVTLHILGAIHHMIVIYGTHVCNDNISKPFLFIFGLLGGKRAKNDQRDKEFCVSQSVSQQPYKI